jgi:hypothetical protein
MEVMMRASAHDHYRAAPEQAIAQAEFEYGGFERRIRELTTHHGPPPGRPSQSAES